ncbi:MAG: hypothetical protein ABIS36_09065 [Chryseolinea sp.]
MSNRTRSIVKAIAVVIVLLVVIMEFRWVIIPAFSPYKVWMVVVAFGMLLVGSK